MSKVAYRQTYVLSRILKKKKNKRFVEKLAHGRRYGNQGSGLDNR